MKKQRFTRIRKLVKSFLDFIHSECEDCHKPLNFHELILLFVCPEGSPALCGKCLDRRIENARYKYRFIPAYLRNED